MTASFYFSLIFSTYLLSLLIVTYLRLSPLFLCLKRLSNFSKGFGLGLGFGVTAVTFPVFAPSRGLSEFDIMQRLWVKGFCEAEEFTEARGCGFATRCVVTVS